MARFRGIAWGPLFIVAVLTVLISTLLDLALRIGAQQLPFLNVVFRIMLDPSWFLLIRLLTGFGLGLLAFVLLEKNTTADRVRLNLATLWSLILCVAIALWLRSLLPLYGVFVQGLNYPTLIGILCGVFWQSRRYWRY